MSNIIIRTADLNDVESIAKVHIQSWQEAYRNLLPQDYLNQLPKQLDQRIEMWKNILKNPQRWSWVAELDQGIVGFIWTTPRSKPRWIYRTWGHLSTRV